MGLLSPWFLAGIAAVGLPVYVHLLRQYKQTPIPFSSLMFFERRTQSSIKHRRLKYLLLFALRCAFVALLVLAFARPYVHSSAMVNPAGGRTMIFAIDNSFSMRQGDRFATAKQAALDQINAMRADDRGQVIAIGGPARLLTEMVTDKQALRAAVNGLEAGDEANAYADLARVLRSTSESMKTQIEAHVFTDLQKSAMPPAFSDLKLDDRIKLEVHAATTAAPPPNWTVENVDAPRRVFDTKKVRTVATIAGFNTPEATRKVTLVANGKALETKEVKVPANGRATVEFLTLDAPYGMTRCEMRIDSADAFPQDDHWLFSVERADPKPALLVHADGETASTLYVKTALESSSEPAFTLQSVAASQTGTLDLAKYAFIILSDPGPTAQVFGERLAKYVQDGGSVLMTLGKNAPLGRHLPVADLQMLTLHTITPDHEAILTAAFTDASYPAFAKAQNWGGVDFFQAARIQLPQSAPDLRVAAKLSDGTPLLIDRTVGEGHAIVFASTFDNISNNLPIQPVWLPFLDQLTHEMGGIGTAPGNYKVDSFADLRTAKEKNVQVEVMGPGDKRLLSLAESSKAQTFRFPSEGFFDIRRANGREELAAVNADRRESDFSVIPPETVELWKNTGIGSGKASSASGAAAGASTRDENAELWWWVLAALAILAVAESLLGNRHIEDAGRDTGNKELA
ncbi:MAG TPA: BatA and WFA domain-containing protein [Bryobacteraceae bacterium]|nr:BatA and WFA domain-containing protein [Bryobacteraceae bacterium]